jgi:hypothetical protein
VGHLIAILALAGAAAGAPAMSTGQPAFAIQPSTPPSCEAVVRARLNGLALSNQTTPAQIAAALGEGRPAGPAGEMLSYHLKCDGILWLSFDENRPRHLTRAVLLAGAFVPRTTTLFDTLRITRRRSCTQLPRGRWISGNRVTRAWGPPDNLVGSGIVRWTYALADGGTGVVLPDSFPHPRRVKVGCRRGAR